MNTSLDGSLSLTKREREIFEKAPLLAAQVALHRPEVLVDAEQLKSSCQKLLAAVDGTAAR